MNTETNLTIQINPKNIAISLPNSSISIVVDNDKQSVNVEKILPPATLEWSKTLLDGETVNYEKAEKVAKELGEGWRLPTRFELESLLDLSRHEPAIDVEKYPDTKSSCYWTSTACVWNSTAVWVVNFNDGLVDLIRRGGSACVRAVRSSQ